MGNTMEIGGKDMPEDKAEIFKPEAKTIAKIFGDADSYYQIPDYQRPYSWEDEHIEQLWGDLYSAMESQIDSYFLGPVILTKTHNGYFDVVDGQQRLTTLIILFCVIRDLYEKNLDDTLINSIKDSIKSFRENKNRLKLITQVHYQNKFENEILKKVAFPTKELSKKQRKQEKFMNTALIFKEKLNELEKSRCADFINYLLNKVEMITITCSKPAYAIKLFQVLNTRGLDLNPADLIKSHLYSKLSDDKKKQFLATWHDIETISEQIDESLTDLLTYYEYYLLAQNPKRSLYEELTDQFTRKDSNTVIYEFKQFVDCFNKISQIESKLMFSFWYLPNQVFWKAILTTAKYGKFEDFDGLCKDLRNVYYCYWIADYTTSKIKPLSFNLIDWLKKGKSLEEIKKEIQEKMKKDKVIKPESCVKMG